MQAIKKQTNLDQEAANFITAEAKRRHISESEMIRELIHVGLSKSDKITSSVNLFEALQIFKIDLISDLKRLPPSMPVQSLQPDLDGFKSALVFEVKQAIASLGNSHQEDQGNAVASTSGITREEFLELVKIVRDEVTENRKFQQAMSEFITKSFANFQATLAGSATKNDGSSVENQLRALEVKFKAFSRLVAENTFRTKYYAGETLLSMIGESSFIEKVNDINDRWSQETTEDKTLAFVVSD